MLNVEQRPRRAAIQLTAAHNLERVRSHMEAHLGCSPKELAYALRLSGDQARRAFRKIRNEWVGK